MGCLALSLWIYFAYHKVQKKADENYPVDKSVTLLPGKLMRMMPSTGYSLLIIPMNLVYKKLAIFMTDFGKHMKQEEILKLFVFCRKSSSANSV